jgi:hypothetical protein
MRKSNRTVLLAVAAVTVASIVTWQATGGDWYTKYEVVEQVEAKIDPNDPLAAAGFYDDGTATETITKDEFRFGLLPTPTGLLDKHVVSVASVTGPAWVIGLGVVWLRRRRVRLPQRTE